MNLIEEICKLPVTERNQLVADMLPEDRLQLLYDWRIWARPEQRWPPGDWRVWLLLAGRGFGKTRTGAEAVRLQKNRGARRIALVAATAADARDVIVEGESGILAVSPPYDMPLYEPSKRRLTWMNGAIATTYSADEPTRLQGPQHDFAYCDELALWKYPEAWDMLLLGLRLGPDPRAVVTTTPKPTKIIRDLVASNHTYLTRGSTFDNRANLPQAFFDAIITRYEGTRLGREQIYAELLTDNPDALWTRANIDELRVTRHPELLTIVVAVDPQATNEPTSSETGIIVAGLGVDKHGYILDDLSIRATPDRWASEVVSAYHKYEANRIVAESNQGGLMVEHTIRTIDRTVPIKLVHASRGKHTRAEPVSALYEQRKCHHMGFFADLEDQMVEWSPGDTSPDRLDALVWALTELMIDTTAEKKVMFV